MFLASVHLPLLATIPVAVALSIALVWYWIRLGRDDVPASRRKIRRFSMAVMLISLPIFVGALSVIDPTPSDAAADAVATAKRQYAVAWTLLMFLMLLTIASALMDAVNNLRIHQNQRQEEITKAAADLALAIRDRRREAGSARVHGVERDDEDAATNHVPEAGA